MIGIPNPYRRVVGAVCLAGAIVAGTVPLGPLPALGSLLDPIHGIWAVARGAELPRSARGRIPGLRARVDVRYDSRGVPHIFAGSEDDAYRALGFVVARDRLFQIEVQVRAGAGTLSELIGAPGLPADRQMRHMGLPAAARLAYARLDTTLTASHVLRAYADGVNAWIAQMGAADLPIEYRLLNRRPTRWAPVDAYYLLNRMSLTLASSDVELARLYAAASVGDTVARVLMPLHSPLQQPMVPTATPLPHFLPGRYPPLPPLGRAGSPMDTLPDEVTAIAAAGPTLGSNGWAVSPKRTRSGFALLAGDPHLDLTLPSIWYEVHLVVPGQLDVAGVTIPGAPAVIIGFTRDLAWTFTNTGADVLDLYAETVDDSVHPRRYRLDGTWRPLAVRVEQYLGPSGAVLATDTVLATHRGPLHHVARQWVSMRWTALDPGGALPALLRAAHAHSTAEWLQAMASYDVPAQNMLVADHTGSIAVRSTGVFPLRPGDGRGDTIRDGSTSTSDWRGVVPIDRYPTAVDPAQGFLASANQEPVDPSAPGPSRDVYLGADWPPPWRAMHLNALLQANAAVTTDDMRRWQTDPSSPRADFFLPYFLAAAHRADSLGRTSPTLDDAARVLAQWDGRYTRVNTSAVLFEAAMRDLARRISRHLAPVSGARGVPVSSTVLAELLHDSSSGWWSEFAAREKSTAASAGGRSAESPVLRTSASRRARPGVAASAPSALAEGIEERDAILAASLAAAYDSTRQRYGAPNGGQWRWDEVRHANIYHLLRIPAFSRLDLPIRGGPETLNPSSGQGTQGASWRMVVQLGPQVRAWAVYPGGQSGNPVSSRYADRLPLWLAGTLDPVRFPHAAADLAGPDVCAVLTLEPRR